jgi:hypothetical protein
MTACPITQADCLRGRCPRRSAAVQAARSALASTAAAGRAQAWTARTAWYAQPLRQSLNRKGQVRNWDGSTTTDRIVRQEGSHPAPCGGRTSRAASHPLRSAEIFDLPLSLCPILRGLPPARLQESGLILGHKSELRQLVCNRASRTAVKARDLLKRLAALELASHSGEFDLRPRSADILGELRSASCSGLDSVQRCHTSQQCAQHFRIMHDGVHWKRLCRMRVHAVNESL